MCTLVKKTKHRYLIKTKQKFSTKLNIKVKLRYLYKIKKKTQIPTLKKIRCQIEHIETKTMY